MVQKVPPSTNNNVVKVYDEIGLSRV